MSEIFNNLSALAVVSELCNNKKDIYGVLWEFVKDVILKRSKWSFTPKELKNALVNEYGFDNIPEAVIKTLLRKQKAEDISFRSNEDGSNNYIILPQFKEKLLNHEYSAELKEYSDKFSDMFNKLSEYIHSNKLDNITDEIILKELKEFLLGDPQNNEIQVIINTFVLQIEKNNPEYKYIMNQIKEGFVIYEGICWSDNLNELGHWNHKMTLYYDMDIIFYMAGYSGAIYNDIFNELNQLISEINSKSAKNGKSRCIKTMYFPEVRKQIEEYFDRAKQIVECKRTLDMKQTAMVHIVENCKTISDVENMSTKLFLKLKHFGIIEDNKSSFYNMEQYSNNIESMELLERYSAKEESSKVEKYIRRINYISMLRNGHVCDKFENCEYLIVTRNRLCSEIARDTDSRLQDQFLKVISPESLTSKFWFQLNKGFGKCIFPKSLDVLIQAKIIMSHQVSKDLAEVYDRLMDEYKNGYCTQEEITVEIANLRKISILPENISTEVMAEAHAWAECDVKNMIEKSRNEKLEEEQKKLYYEELEAENQSLKQINEDESIRAEEEIAAGQEKDKEIELLKEQLNAVKEQNKSFLDERAIEETKKSEEKRRKEKRKKIVSIVFIAILTILTVILFIFNYNLIARIVMFIDVISIINQMCKFFNKKVNIELV